MNRSIDVEIKVGVFVAIGTIVLMLCVFLIGGGKTVFSSHIRFHSKFNQVEGLIEGATVKVSGVKVGQVDQIKFLKNSGSVEVNFSVNSKYKDAIHKDSTVSIQTQGVLGDRYVVILPGTPAVPLAQDGDELLSEAPKELKDYLNTADEVLDRLKNSLAQVEKVLTNFNHDGRSDKFFKNITNLSSNINTATDQLPQKIDHFYKSLNHLDSILAKVDRGEGTIGALINDPTLYDDMKALLGGANRNRVLKYFIRKSVEESRESRGAASE